MSLAFENLLLYHKSAGLADAALCGESRDFSRGYFFLADQLNRDRESVAFVVTSSAATIA